VDILQHYCSILDLRNVTIIAPDQGSSARLARSGYDVISIHKTRQHGNILMKLDAEVVGKDCLIIDDIIDSGQTMEAAAQCLKAHGASSVKAYCTHFLGNNKPSMPLYTTNTVPLMIDKRHFVAILPITPVIRKFLQQ